LKQYEDLWQQVLSSLHEFYSEDIFDEIFSQLSNVKKHSGGYIYVIAPNPYTKSRIERLYLGRINHIASTIYKKELVKFKFVLAEELIGETSLVGPEKNLEHKYRHGDLNATLSFDNFVVGKSNRFAFQMALKVADQPGVVANPFYIFGDVGLGKTHLMQAIGNYIADNDITKNILYIKASAFIEEFANQLKNQTIDEFNEKYRDVDVLLIDDIQMMSGAPKTQMEFFKVFDFLTQQNKQIVITSDKPASELKNIMSRLTSRFEQGLLVDIGVPDLEHRVEILRKKLTTEAPDVNDLDLNVLEFIASYFNTNVRELEGALKRVLFYCVTNNIDITIDTATEALDSLIKTRKKTAALTENNYDKIQSVVSDYYAISVHDLIGKRRNSKYTLPRHIAMYLIKNKYNIAYKTIGSLFGNRDHSTVLAACEKIENELKHNNEMKIAVDTILKKIEKYSN
jgi:chromosomal replication initiator protein